MKWFKHGQLAQTSPREDPCILDEIPVALATSAEAENWLQIAQPQRQHPLSRAAAAVLRPFDHLCNHVYGSRLNPLYQSGALAIFLFAVVIVTGVYLLFFYRVAAPYESVLRLHQQPWTGRWLRALHRYASDAAMVAVFFHVLRMIAHGRTWGPRVVAWISGLVLTGVLLLSGWTGQVLVWDAQAQLLAIEGARLADLLPIFSEPVGRSFISNAALSRSFFFLNLFLHVALPLGAVVMLWIHVSRLARPRLFPPRGLALGILTALTLFAIIWPPYMLDKADLLRLPTRFAIDWFFCFWLPVVRAFSLPGHGAFVLLSLVLLTVPWWLRPQRQQRPQPSHDNVELCQGCDQCWQDCPFEAIRMLPRQPPSGRASERVAIVDATLCVACGICAGSCAPMAIGPPQRTGRVQLQALRGWSITPSELAGKAVVLACSYNELSRDPQLARRADIVLQPMNCSGALHTSVIEQLLRLGAKGVCVVSCPSRNCVNREGPKWLFERVYNDREAELSSRVDRNRVQLLHGGVGERRLLMQALEVFCHRIDRQAEPRSAVAISPDAPQRPVAQRLLVQARQFIPRLLVTAIFLILLAVGNRTPVGHPSNDGVLRLAWRLSGANMTSCREVTPAELATKPVHMRQARECLEQPLSYHLELTLNGETRLNQTVTPAGARGDRPLYVQQDLRLVAGAYTMAVDFRPLLPAAEELPGTSDTSPEQQEAPSHQPQPLTLHARVDIVPDRVTLIDYDAQAQQLVIVQQHKR